MRRTRCLLALLACCLPARAVGEENPIIPTGARLEKLWGELAQPARASARPQDAT
jgi:hypothetical protein